MDQFGHPADRQPRSLDLRSEEADWPRQPRRGNGPIVRADRERANRHSVEARSPGGGLRGASNWIDVQRTPDRQLLWTDFSPEAMRALPSVPFSAVEPFTGDDQLGAALTRQVVPMIDIPEPSTEALPGSGLLIRKWIQCRRNRRFGRASCRADSQLHGQHRKVSGLGLRTRDRRKFRGRSRLVALGDQLSGGSSALEANSASTDGSLAVSEQAGAAPEIGIDADGVMDQEPALDRDSGRNYTISGTLADNSMSLEPNSPFKGHLKSKVLVAEMPPIRLLQAVRQTPMHRSKRSSLYRPMGRIF